MKLSLHSSGLILYFVSLQLYFVNDPYPRVRAEAIRIIAHCLAKVKVVPINDGNIFPEYILPAMVSWSSEHSYNLSVLKLPLFPQSQVTFIAWYVLVLANIIER